MHVLGLSCGGEDGSAEVLLKAALLAAEESGVTTSLVRLQDIRMSVGPGSECAADDSAWFLEQMLAADGVIASSPIYSRTIPGPLKLLLDRVLGPKADAAFAEASAAMANDPNASVMMPPVDARVLKNRAAGLITIGGCQEAQWRSLSLPLLHILTFSMHIAVADQIEVITPGGVGGVATSPDSLARAARLGRAVAEQVGLPFDEVEYRGEPGICPICHLNVVIVRDSRVECGTCGAYGAFEVDGGSVSVKFSEEGTVKSIFGMEEKRAHLAELMDNMRKEPEAIAIERDVAVYKQFDRRILPV